MRLELIKVERLIRLGIEVEHLVAEIANEVDILFSRFVIRSLGLSLYLVD